MRLHPKLFAALLLTGGLLAQQRGASEPKVAGRLEAKDGIDVLYLHGTVEERGFAEGYLCAERIRALFRGVALSEKVVPSPGLWSLLVVPRVAQMVDVPPWVGTWAEAVIDGIEAKDGDLLEIPELNREIQPIDLVACAALPDFLGLACSSFAAWGDDVDGDGPLIGRNLDYFATDELLRQTMVIVHAPRPGRAGWVSIGWPGIAGCLTGVSEHGVGVAIHDVPADAIDGSKITPRPLALQELIERFVPGEAPAEEAAAILRGFRYGMGGNFLVGWRRDGDRGAGGAVFEVWPAAELADGVVVRGATDGHDFVVCTNHHRARIEPEKRCWRYFALHDALGAAADPLSMADARAMIRKSEVPATLYQSVIDLETGELALRLRRVPREDRWSEVAGWDADALLRAVD